MKTADPDPVVVRFFEAIDRLQREKRIRSRSAFYARYGITRRNADTQRSDPTRRILRPCWLTYLVTDYAVSPLWLLTGEGSFHRVSAEKREQTVTDIHDLLLNL